MLCAPFDIKVRLHIAYGCVLLMSTDSDVKSIEQFPTLKFSIDYFPSISFLSAWIESKISLHEGTCQDINHFQTTRYIGL